MNSACPPLLADVTDRVTLSLTIRPVNQLGEIVPPRTKKNSPQLIPHMKHPIMVPSEAYREWERNGLRQLARDGVLKRDHLAKTWVYLGGQITVPVNCRALIYRDRLVGDAVGFYQAIGDFLEVAGIVQNDRLIQSWDGTRLLKDAARPRIELVLEEVRYV